MNRLLIRQRNVVLVGRRLKSNLAAAKKTCLYDFHAQNGAKFVEFCGFQMPIQYSDLSIQKSSLHTRHHASIFDVSHMLQTEIHGKDAIEFFESLTPADIQGLPENSGCLSVFTNEKGGIKDDLVVSKTDKGYLYVVSNAGCIDKDVEHMKKHEAEWKAKGKDVEVRVLDKYGLIALQGPEAVLLLETETDIDLSHLYFMQTAVGTVAGVPDCRVTRCGYTGEDGFEIQFPIASSDAVPKALIGSKRVSTRLAGLGARNVLRLEAGLCLYGDDITETTTPIEAGLNFVVAKRRRQTLGFPGAEVIVKQIQDKKVPKKRVGLMAEGGRSPREHLPLVDPMDKACIGFVTSGSPSPTLNKNIAMGYVDFRDSKIGTQVQVDFGAKQSNVTVVKMPFHPTNYFVKPKN
ncbi:unnamed protein product [Bursaphelenchus okinawaensis]|uniref:Aminomethyltransferase n=1 Tax=Bursaphelenchus okinawaensis TaxID=465554 RepID=A0A811L9V4_9BILA|nr:unnamed protein product [Bursaphelenchus okinawaensis]CAG9120385.1 unnamed protein product [Bursaphelenchus okinawaensis]